jgi:uncharacterized protein YdeI (YjbR/CyaY-like superfamily)
VEVAHFRDAAAFRRWLEKHHHRADEVWVGFYRKDSGKGGLTYKEALDEALCFGWIDGIRKKVDEKSYTNRFTPRQAKSTWSLVNIRRMGELLARGVVAAAGKAAFEARDPKRSGKYSFENRPASLTPGLARQFRRHKDAWTFFAAQPPGYRRIAIWYVMSAVRDETRQRRLDVLIDCCARHKRLPMMEPAKKR